jgi:hypothetical protein
LETPPPSKVFAPNPLTAVPPEIAAVRAADKVRVLPETAVTLVPAATPMPDSVWPTANPEMSAKVMLVEPSSAVAVREEVAVTEPEIRVLKPAPERRVSLPAPPLRVLPWRELVEVPPTRLCPTLRVGDAPAKSKLFWLPPTSVAWPLEAYIVLLPDPPRRLTVPWDDVASNQLLPDPPIIVVEAEPAIKVALPVLDAAERVFCMEVPPSFPMPVRLPAPTRLSPRFVGSSVRV